MSIYYTLLSYIMQFVAYKFFCGARDEALAVNKKKTATHPVTEVASTTQKHKTSQNSTDHTKSTIPDNTWFAKLVVFAQDALYL